MSLVEVSSWRASFCVGAGLPGRLVVPLGIALALKMIPADVMAECRARSQTAMAEGKPVNWVAAGVIIAIWLMVAAPADYCDGSSGETMRFGL